MSLPCFSKTQWRQPVLQDMVAIFNGLAGSERLRLLEIESQSRGIMDFGTYLYHRPRVSQYRKIASQYSRVASQLCPDNEHLDDQKQFIQRQYVRLQPKLRWLCAWFYMPSIAMSAPYVTIIQARAILVCKYIEILFAHILPAIPSSAAECIASFSSDFDIKLVAFHHLQSYSGEPIQTAQELASASIEFVKNRDPSEQLATRVTSDIMSSVSSLGSGLFGQ